MIINNLKSKYKKVFDEVKIENEEADDIFRDVLIRGERKKKTRKFFYSLCLFLTIFTIAISITYAKEIKNIANTFIVKYITKDDDTTYLNVESNAIKEIDEQADLEEVDFVGELDRINGNYKSYSFEELEKILGIKLLKSNKFQNQNLIIDHLEKKDNKITKITIDLDNIFNYSNGSNKKIYADCTMEIKTKYNLANEKDTGIDGISSVQEFWEYHIENLNTDSVIIKDKYFPSHLMVKFDYDNVTYSFDTFIFTEDPESELYKILESLNY